MLWGKRSALKVVLYSKAPCTLVRVEAWSAAEAGIDMVIHKFTENKMKIAICSQSNDVNAMVDSRFGRSAFFAVYDDVSGQWEFIANSQNLQAPQGAGIQAAQAVINTGAENLIAANVGPKAMAALTANGISVFGANTTMTLEQTLEAYKKGSLEQLQDSNVEGHWV